MQQQKHTRNENEREHTNTQIHIEIMRSQIASGQKWNEIKGSKRGVFVALLPNLMTTRTRKRVYERITRYTVYVMLRNNKICFFFSPPTDQWEASEQADKQYNTIAPKNFEIIDVNNANHRNKLFEN